MYYTLTQGLRYGSLRKRLKSTGSIFLVAAALPIATALLTIDTSPLHPLAAFGSDTKATSKKTVPAPTATSTPSSSSGDSTTQPPPAPSVAPAYAPSVSAVTNAPTVTTPSVVIGRGAGDASTLSPAPSDPVVTSPVVTDPTPTASDGGVIATPPAPDPVPTTAPLVDVTTSPLTADVTVSPDSITATVTVE